MKKWLLCVFTVCITALLLTACGYEIGVGEATVEEIENGIVTIEYMGQSYTWEDPDGALKYGLCTIAYKYKEGRESTTLKIQKVEQKSELQHEKGDVRQIGFETKILPSTTVPLEVYADDFYAVVKYWGDSAEHKEDVILIDENGEEVYGWKLTAANTQYSIDLQWKDITGTAKITTGPTRSTDTYSQNKHTCEVCSKEGTHRYESFTGQTEYYCTEHYNEMMNLMKELGLN